MLFTFAELKALSEAAYQIEAIKSNIESVASEMQSLKNQLEDFKASDDFDGDPNNKTYVSLTDAYRKASKTLLGLKSDLIKAQMDVAKTTLAAKELNDGEFEDEDSIDPYTVIKGTRNLKNLGKGVTLEKMKNKQLNEIIGWNDKEERSKAESEVNDYIKSITDPIDKEHMDLNLKRGEKKAKKEKEDEDAREGELWVLATEDGEYVSMDDDFTTKASETKAFKSKVAASITARFINVPVTPIPVPADKVKYIPVENIVKASNAAGGLGKAPVKVDKKKAFVITVGERNYWDGGNDTTRKLEEAAWFDNPDDPETQIEKLAIKGLFDYDELDYAQIKKSEDKAKLSEDNLIERVKSLTPNERAKAAYMNKSINELYRINVDGQYLTPTKDLTESEDDAWYFVNESKAEEIANSYAEKENLVNIPDVESVDDEYEVSELVKSGVKINRSKGNNKKNTKYRDPKKAIKNLYICTATKSNVRGWLDMYGDVTKNRSEAQAFTSLDDISAYETKFQNELKRNRVEIGNPVKVPKDKIDLFDGNIFEAWGIESSDSDKNTNPRKPSGGSIDDNVFDIPNGDIY